MHHKDPLQVHMNTYGQVHVDTYGCKGPADRRRDPDPQQPWPSKVKKSTDPGQRRLTQVSSNLGDLGGEEIAKCGIHDAFAHVADHMELHETCGDIPRTQNR